MKVDYLETLLPIGSLEASASGALAALIDGFVTRSQVHEDKQEELSYWQRIFLQSKANGCFYRGEDLPETNWDWPRNTWFQERLSHMRSTR